MAITQGEVQQQPPTPAATGQASSAAPNARPASSSQAPSPAPPVSQTQQPAGANADQGHAPSAELNFSQILEQQIAQAIQPVLAEFRQNVAQTMSQQMASMPSPAARVTGEGALQTPLQGQGVQQPGGQQPAQQPPVQQAAQQVVGQLPQPAQAAGSVVQSVTQPVSPDQQGLSVPTTGILRPALQAMERQSAQWLQSLLVAGVGALVTESTHAAIQQRAERGLHTLLQKLFEAAPEGVSNPEMQGKMERMLQTILRESLDALFVGGLLTTVQQGGQQAIQNSLHGDFGAALGRVEDTLKAMAEALLTVLRRHRQSVFRLLLALVLLELESSLAQSGTDSK